VNARNNLLNYRIVKMEWKKVLREKAMKVAESIELSNNRVPKRVDRDGIGYDILSIGENEERHIEVKGVSEGWASYTWQALHHTQVKALKKNPAEFFLYIVRFDILHRENRNSEFLETASPQLYIIPGKDLLGGGLGRFKIQEESFALKPISKTSLAPYKADLGTAGPDPV
jgi:hypothetical protein